MENVDYLLKGINNKKMLLVFPHPDDETVWTSGLVQRALELGWKVKVMCLTNGERGQVHIKPNGRSLSQIRQAEMKKAMSVLGADYVMFDFGDGRLKTGKKWIKKIREMLGKEKPGLVVTYDHSGISGHPDHIVVSVELFKIMKKLNSSKLLWVSAAGMARSYLETRVKSFEYLLEPEFELRLGLKAWFKKHLALWSHRSQPLRNVKKLFLFYPKEHFVLADFSRKYKYKYISFEI